MFAKFSNMFNNVRFHGPGGIRQRPHDRASGDTFSNRASDDGSSPTSNKKPCTRNTSNDGDDEATKSCQVDNSQAVISKIAALYAERLMSDITLVINGVEYPAHRLILCASSDVFQVMLMNRMWCESQESRVYLHESNECADSFEDFLKYLYTGRLKLDIAKVMYVLILADKYNVQDLIDLCINYMNQHIPEASSRNFLILWYQYTVNNCGSPNHSALSKLIRNYITWNFELASRSDDFHLLEKSMLSSILAEDNLVVYDEFSLYSIVEYWVKVQVEELFNSNNTHRFKSQEDAFVTFMDCLMQFIRFPMMTPRQLADLIQSPVVRRCPALMENMAIAMGFHNGQLSNFTEAINRHPQKDHFFTPRLYTTDQWSVSIVTPMSRLGYYQKQTMMFMTSSSFSDSIRGKQIEWCLDFYPKGVQFQKYFLIGWHATTEMPEQVLRTVRLSATCLSEDNDGKDVRVQIGVLIAGYQDGVEYCRKVVRRNYIFTEKDIVVNIDDLIPYGEINPCAACRVVKERSPPPGDHLDERTYPQNTSRTCTCPNGRTNSFAFSDTIKLRVVITPMNEVFK